MRLNVRQPRPQPNISTLRSSCLGQNRQSLSQSKFQRGNDILTVRFQGSPQPGLGLPLPSQSWEMNKILSELPESVLREALQPSVKSVSQLLEQLMIRAMDEARTLREYHRDVQSGTIYPYPKTEILSGFLPQLTQRAILQRSSEALISAFSSALEVTKWSRLAQYQAVGAAENQEASQVILRQVLTGFIQHIPSKQNRTLSDFFAYLQNLERNKEMPQELRQCQEMILDPLSKDLASIPPDKLPLPDDVLSLRQLNEELPFFPFPKILDSHFRPSPTSTFQVSLQSMAGWVLQSIEELIQADRSARTQENVYYEPRLNLLSAFLPAHFDLNDFSPEIQTRILEIIKFNFEHALAFLSPVASEDEWLQDPFDRNADRVNIDLDFARLLTALVKTYRDLQVRTFTNLVKLTEIIGDSADTPTSIRRAAGLFRRTRGDIVWCLTHPKASWEDFLAYRRQENE